MCQAEGEDMKHFRPPANADVCMHMIHNEQSMKTLPTFKPLEVVGKRFLKHHNRFPHQAKVLEPMEDSTKFLVALADGEREKIVTYHEIIDLYKIQLDEVNGNQAWLFEPILAHRM